MEIQTNTIFRKDLKNPAKYFNFAVPSAYDDYEEDEDESEEEEEGE
jgi:hypothetical protein